MRRTSDSHRGAPERRAFGGDDRERGGGRNETTGAGGGGGGGYVAATRLGGRGSGFAIGKVAGVQTLAGS
ncbi:unnamed protein product [Lampetra planeri]